MAVAFDVQVGYGWSFPAGIACAIVVIVMLFVIILHIRYFRHTQLATRILVNLCISILLFHLMLLIAIFASDVDDLSATGCGAMGALLQLTAVAQFLWILALVNSIYMYLLYELLWTVFNNFLSVEFKCASTYICALLSTGCCSLGKFHGLLQWEGAPDHLCGGRLGYLCACCCLDYFDWSIWSWT